MLFFAHIIQMQLRATTNDPAADPWVLPGIGSSVWPESEVSVDSHRTLVPPESGRSILSGFGRRIACQTAGRVRRQRQRGTISRHGQSIEALRCFESGAPFVNKIRIEQTWKNAKSKLSTAWACTHGP